MNTEKRTALLAWLSIIMLMLCAIQVGRIDYSTPIQQITILQLTSLAVVAAATALGTIVLLALILKR